MPIQFPYEKKVVADVMDNVEAEDHNKQEDQLFSLTAERGGTWDDDAGRPTPSIDAPYPHGFNKTRLSYEFWNGSVWVQTGGALAAHAPQHEFGGADVINVGGLSGLLADPQTPEVHAPTHEGGSDPIDPAGIGADTPALRDSAIATHAGISAAHHSRPVDGELLPAAHASTHEGGSDPIDIALIGGDLAGAPRPPTSHRGTHVSGGSDTFFSTDVIEVIVKRILEAGGGVMQFGSIPNNTFLRRSGTSVIGFALNVVEKECPGPGGQTYGDYSTTGIGPNSAGYFSFCVPSDFVSLVSLELIGIVTPSAALAARDIDLFSDYAAVGENYQNHSAADTTTLYDLSAEADRIYSFDVSSIFTSLAAGDACGLHIQHNSIGGTIHYLGVRLVYNR